LAAAAQATAKEAAITAEQAELAKAKDAINQALAGSPLPPIPPVMPIPSAPAAPVPLPPQKP
jgi:hypothetical protein